RKSRQLNRLVSEIESTMNEMMTNADSNVFWIVTHGNKENVNLLITSLAEVKNEILTYTELEENNFLFNGKIYDEIIRAIRRDVTMMVLLPERDINSLFSQFYKDFISNITPFIGKNLLIRTVEDVHTPFDVVDGEKVNIMIKSPSMPKQFLAAVTFLDKDLASTLKEEFYALWKKAKPLDMSKINRDKLF
ncbi:transcriptional regulator, partial [groundwater metagenome]